MSFETDLRSLVLADTDVSNKVGTRAYWETRPQATALPSLVMTGVSGVRAQHMAGLMATQGHRVQFDSLATTKAQASDLRAAVIDAIEGGGTGGTTDFQGAFVNLLPARIDDTPDGVIRTERFDATIWFN